MAAVMERSMCTSPANRRQNYYYDGDQNPTPPWEQRNAAQVPYMRPHSPPLTQAERQALPSLWATRDNSSPDPPGAGAYDRGYANYARSISPHYDGMHRFGVKTPLTAPPLNPPRPPPPAPKDSHKFFDGPKSAPQLPAFVKAPPSPPESHCLSRSSTKSSAAKSHHDGSRNARPSVTALPGTMSTRERTRSRSRTASASRDRDNHQKGDKPESLTFGKRFKMAIKDIFKRDPIDESCFEHIQDRHWTEE